MADRELGRPKRVVALAGHYTSRERADPTDSLVGITGSDPRRFPRPMCARFVEWGWGWGGGTEVPAAVRAARIIPRGVVYDDVSFSLGKGRRKHERQTFTAGF